MYHHNDCNQSWIWGSGAPKQKLNGGPEKIFWTWSVWRPKKKDHRKKIRHHVAKTVFVRTPGSPFKPLGASPGRWGPEL